MIERHVFTESNILFRVSVVRVLPYHFNTLKLDLRVN